MWKSALGQPAYTVTELEIGRLLNRNLYQSKDIGLIHRALEAVYIWDTARLFKQDQDLLSDDQWSVVVKLNQTVSPLTKRPKRVFKRV